MDRTKLNKYAVISYLVSKHEQSSFEIGLRAPNDFVILACAKEPKLSARTSVLTAVPGHATKAACKATKSLR